MWEGMSFFAFDSFQGPPEPGGVEGESKDSVKGKFACTEAVYESRAFFLEDGVIPHIMHDRRNRREPADGSLYRGADPLHSASKST